MKRASLLMLAAIALAGCSPTLDEQRAENRVRDAIAPGVYSNVAAHAATGDLLGYRLHLTEGSDSQTAEISMCQGECGAPLSAPVRRGLNGIFFELPGDGQGRGPTVVAIAPERSGVTLSADWGQGLETVSLPRQADEALPEGFPAAPPQ